MRKRISRTLSIILAAAMVLTAVPVDVYANYASYETDIQADEVRKEEHSLQEDVIVDDETTNDEVIFEKNTPAIPYFSSDEDNEELFEHAESDKDHTFEITDEAEIPSEGNAIDNTGANTKFKDSGYFVVSANRLVEENAKDGYEPLTDSPVHDHELFSAFYNDIIYERQGGKWFRGYDVIRYEADSTKVYDPENYSRLISENSIIEAVPLMGDDRPSSIGGKGDMVFLLDKMPAELSGQFKLLLTTFDENGNYVYNYRDMDPDSMKLYAWEYQLDQSDDRYYRVGVKEIAPEDYELYIEDGVFYTNVQYGDGHDYIKADTVKGAVRINSSIAKDVQNPIAIVAMVYDAGAGGYESVENLTEDDFSLIWDNDIVYHTLKESVYAPNYNNYLDDMYSAAAMGSFSLDAYSYYKDENTHTVYLYDANPAQSYISYGARGYLDNYYFYVRDDAHKLDLIDTWEIPANYEDTHYKKESGTNWHVAIGNVKYEGIRRSLYPGLASSFVIDYGVTLPENSNGLLAGGSLINATASFEIKGNGYASVGGGQGTTGTIKSLANFMGGTQAERKLIKVDVKALDTSNVTDMSHMFEDITILGYSGSLNVDVSHFNTSKVKNFESMFKNYHVTDMAAIRGFYTHVDVRNWDTSAAENMSWMFSGMYLSPYKGDEFGTLDLSNWKFTNKLKTMQGMFAYNPMMTGGGLHKIIFPANMDTGGVKDMSYLFAGDNDLSEITNLTAMDTDSVIDMSNMFGVYFYEGLFGSKYSKTKQSAEDFKPIDEMPGESGSWLFDRWGYTFDKYHYHAHQDSSGPALNKLDLSNFNTHNVRYAYGAFYDMKNVSEIIWGTDTTFENVTDSTYMFVLPAMTKLDLTGRKLTSIRYAHGMFDLPVAQEIILGEESLGLSNIASDGRFTITSEVETLDLSNVAFGTNTHALDRDSLYNTSWSVYNSGSGLTKLEELILPAGMPVMAKPAALRQTFFDNAGNPHDYVTGGNADPLKLTTSASGYELTGIGVSLSIATADDEFVDCTDPGSVAIDLNIANTRFIDEQDRTYHFTGYAKPYADNSTD